MSQIDIGITATRGSLTAAQATALGLVLCAAHTLRHGDCRGGDAHAHRLALKEKMARGGRLRIVIYPPSLPGLRAYCGSYDEIKEEKPYLDRNKDIVDDCGVLVALPKEGQEELRSGTWSTVRYARKRGKPVWIIYPDGTMDIGDTSATSEHLRGGPSVPPGSGSGDHDPG